MSDCAVILAAGKGTRMNSILPKVMHRISGTSLLEHVIAQVKRCGIHTIYVVVGYGKEQISSVIKQKGVYFVEQKEQKGTGHALRCAKKALAGKTGDMIVLPGDAFFLGENTLSRFIKSHRKSRADMTVLSTLVDEPCGYGRVIREKKAVAGIREELDCVADEKQINEINSGVYAFKRKSVGAALKKVPVNKKKNEYYLTDIVSVLCAQQKKVGAFCVTENESVLGINDRIQLSEIQAMDTQKIIKAHQKKGVTVIDPMNTYIEDNVRIGKDTIIYPFTYIEKDVTIGADARLGPFCKIRSSSVIGDKSAIGSFVEVVRSRVGKKTNIKHLSYIGDAHVGSDVNIGAGTITANYDGKNKHRTTVKDGAFIGSNSVLIAPVSVGKKAKTGAGSVLTPGNDIPEGQVAFGVPARIQEHKRKRG